MPNASTYIIDVANIRPGGSATKGLYVGSSESKYATLGSTCIYDKVLYEISVDNIEAEPNAQTVVIPYTSKKTHGNGVSDTLYINPSTKAITANQSTAETKTTTVTVNQALTLDGTTTGSGVTITITQKKDYPTSIKLTITPNSKIPASGGTITSALTNYTYSVEATYKSGNNGVTVTDSCTISADTKQISVGSKGTSASTDTVAGTITFFASYVCNGVTATTTTPVDIVQKLNQVESYANPTFTLSPGTTTLPASGGSVTGSISTPQQVRTWSSTATDTISPSYTSAWTSQTISCVSRETTTGNTQELGTTKVSITANGKTSTDSYKVYQQANAVVSTTWGDIIDAPTGSCSDIPAGGGTVYASASSPQTLRQYYKYNYTSTAQDADWSNQNVSCAVAFVNGNSAYANSLSSTETTSRTYITSLAIRATANGKTKDGSINVYQAVNSRWANWGSVNMDNATLSCGPAPVLGGTVYPSTGGTLRQYYKYAYSSGYEDPDWSITNITATDTSYDPTYFSAGSNAHNTGAPILGYASVTWTGYNNNMATKQVPVYQNADSYSLQSTGASVSLRKSDTDNFPGTGGTKYVYIGLTTTYTYVWASDGGTFTSESHDGTASMSCTGCTLSSNSAADGDRITVNVGQNPSSSQRSITVSASYKGTDNTNGWTQDGYTPSTPTFTITNESSYDLHLSFATTNGTFQKDFVGGYGQIVTISATTLPITVYEIAGSISPGSDYTKVVELYNSSGTITASFDTSYNAWYGTGQVTVDSNPGLNNMTIIVS